MLKRRLQPRLASRVSIYLILDPPNLYCASSVLLAKTEVRAEGCADGTGQTVAAPASTTSLKDAAVNEGHSSSKPDESHSNNIPPVERFPKAAKHQEIEGPIRQMLLSARVHRSQKVLVWWQHVQMFLETQMATHPLGPQNRKWSEQNSWLSTQYSWPSECASTFPVTVVQFTIFVRFHHHHVQHSHRMHERKVFSQLVARSNG